MSWSLQKIRSSLVSSQLDTSQIFPISQLHFWGNSSWCQCRKVGKGNWMHREEIGRAGAHHPAPAALAGPWISSSARAAGVEVVWSRLSSAPLTLLFGCCCDTVTHCLENDHESETETFIGLCHHQAWTEPHGVTKFYCWNLEFHGMTKFYC